MHATFVQGWLSLLPRWRRKGRVWLRRSRQSNEAMRHSWIDCALLEPKSNEKTELLIIVRGQVSSAGWQRSLAACLGAVVETAWWPVLEAVALRVERSAEAPEDPLDPSAAVE